MTFENFKIARNSQGTLNTVLFLMEAFGMTAADMILAIDDLSEDLPIRSMECMADEALYAKICGVAKGYEDSQLQYIDDLMEAIK